MSVFKDADEAAQYLGRIWELLGADPDIGPKLAATNLVLRGRYTDPEFQATITCRDASVKVEYGDSDAQPDVTLMLTSDVGHHFWLGSLNLPMAMARKQVQTDGKMSAVMKVLPFLKPGYGIYRSHCTAQGREDLLTK